MKKADTLDLSVVYNTRCGSHFGNFKNLSLYTSCYTKYFVKRVFIYPKFCGLSEYVQFQNVRLITKSTLRF